MFLPSIYLNASFSLFAVSIAGSSLLFASMGYFLKIFTINKNRLENEIHNTIGLAIHITESKLLKARKYKLKIESIKKVSDYANYLLYSALITLILSGISFMVFWISDSEFYFFWGIFLQFFTLLSLLFSTIMMLFVPIDFFSLNKENTEPEKPDYKNYGPP